MRKFISPNAGPAYVSAGQYCNGDFQVLFRADDGQPLETPDLRISEPAANALMMELVHKLTSVMYIVVVETSLRTVVAGFTTDKQDALDFAASDDAEARLKQFFGVETIDALWLQTIPYSEPVLLREF